jgi:NodT family efflux transporter outer membrane factor (OMF) lipoprotein
MKHVALLFACVLPAACRSVGPDYAPPEFDVPARWAGAPASPPSGLSPALADWTRTFEDPVLHGLVARALAANLDLARARERLKQARASAKRAGAELEPRLDAGASYERSERSLNASSASASPFAGDREADLFRTGFDASWEIDLYGGLARSVEATRAEFEAAAADLGSARTSVVAEIARAYAELRGAQRRREVAASSLASQVASAELVKVRVDAGLTSELDLALASALAAGTRSRLPDFEREATERADRIALLLGEPAGTLRAELAVPGPIPRARALPDLGLPAELLHQRPDLRAAERRLAAQTARIGSAEAERYPQLRLLGSLGLAASEFRDLPEGHSVAWAIGPSLSLPVFDGERIDAQVELETARADELALAYRQALLVALKEVEDALSAVAAARGRSDALEQAVESQARASELADQLYTAGLSDYLAVLVSQRQLYDFQDQLVQSRTQESVQIAAACKALGGGWDPTLPEPRIATHTPTER